MRGEGDPRLAGARAAAELAALVRESVTAGAPRHVLHLRSGGCGAAHHRRLLREALMPVLAGARARVFDLPNGDLVAVAPPPAPVLEAARRTLAAMLDAEASDMLRSLRLPGAAVQVLAAAGESLGLDPPEPPPPLLPAPPGAPPDLAALARAERALQGADLAPVTQVERVWRLDPEAGSMEPLWEERRVDTGALGASLLPGMSLGAAPELARRLARLAEARLLAESVRMSALAAWRPFGVALSPQAVSEPAFLRFDAALPVGRRPEVVLSFQTEDILAAPAAFTFARDLARSRGYRLAVEGAPEPLRPGALGLDLLRLRWSPALAASGEVPAGPEVILAGVDRPGAIAWGWERGIRLFQGPLIGRRPMGG